MFGPTSEESIQVIKDWTLCGKFPNEVLPRGKGAAAMSIESQEIPKIHS